MSKHFTASKVMFHPSVGKVREVERPDSSTFRDPVKSFVGSALNISSALNEFWDVIDLFPKGSEEPQLALAHYNQYFDAYNRFHEPLRKVRGIIVDLKTGAIVCDSYGHTQSLPCYEPIVEQITESTPNGTMQIATQIAMYINSVETAPEEPAKFNIGRRTFDSGSTKLFLGYEGVMVRVFKWNNEIFFSTHRRINAYNSDWGGRKQFFKLYQELNGPDLSSLFGEEHYSPYCYMFLIAHDEIRLASSTRDNRIVYLGMKKVWSEETYAGEGGPYYSSTPFVRYDILVQELTSAFSSEHTHSLIVQPLVSVDIANKFLFPKDFAKEIPRNVEYDAKENEIIIEYGPNGVEEIYANVTRNVGDERLAGGDFIIMYTLNEQGQTVVYRLESPAFEYRVTITDNDPNIYHRFATQMVDFTKASPADLTEKYPQYVDSTGKYMTLVNPPNRRKFWWSLFYDAVPPSYKSEVDSFYKRYEEDINKVAKFILHEYPRMTDEAELNKINENTRKRMVDIRGVATNSKIAGQPPFNVVRNLLYQETGKSFYKMITTIRNLEKFRKSLTA